MKLIRNEIRKNLSPIKLLIIVTIMIIVSFAVIESNYSPSSEPTLLGKYFHQKERLEKQEEIYGKEATYDNLFLVKVAKLSMEIEEIQNNHSFYRNSWQDKLIVKINDMHQEIVALEMIKDGIDSASFKRGFMYKYISVDEASIKWQSLNENRAKYMELLKNGTYADYVNEEIKDLELRIAENEKSSDEYKKREMFFDKEQIKIKQYIVDKQIKDDQDVRVIAQQQLEELILNKDYKVISSSEFNDSYTIKKDYGTYDNYLRFTKDKEERINDEYHRLWYAMENKIELSNATKGVVSQFWQLSFLLSFAVVILLSSIVSKEYKSGSIRLLLTQGINRHKIILSKFMTIILSTYGLYLLFLIIYLCLACYKGHFEDLLEPEIIISFGNTVTINYFVYLLGELLICGLPSLFIVTTVFLISIIRESAILSTVIGTLLSLSSLFAEFIIIFIRVLKWHFLRFLPTSYLSLPTFKYSSLFSNYNELTFYILNRRLGIIVLLISIVLMYITAHIIFVRRDIRN